MHNVIASDHRPVAVIIKFANGSQVLGIPEHEKTEIELQYQMTCRKTSSQIPLNEELSKFDIHMFNSYSTTCRQIWTILWKYGYGNMVMPFKMYQVKLYAMVERWAQFCCKMWGHTSVRNQYSLRVDAEVTFYIYRLPILFLEVFWEQH